ncbi:MAG: phenylalanine--tRNA ligase subunit beta [Tepidanaerobacteraceae bacterium]|jgi:phenylalanyl-tRNA synthetase beta chain|nr:phenylalanine--tRNA ligase subunit beta [Tepidanaerobacteraceae bacterium]
MLVSLKWLKDYVNIDDEISSFTERMTMSGSNVEGIERLGKDIDKIVIGRIEKIERHPDADKLLIVQVDIGDRLIQVVTAAANIKEKDLVPVAMDGAVIHGGKQISTVKFKGVNSSGMLCSAAELGFDDHGLPEDMKKGIMILPQDAPVGKNIKEFLELEDTVIDFEITPNRPDCLSIIGIARETAATYRIDLNMPEIILKEEADENARDMAKITIEAPDLCKRYVARIIKDVRIEPSPLWMQRRLQACGIRSINNIVDITNYVMLELGQPLHAFDYDKLEGHSIIVRRGRDSEGIVTLDGVYRLLSDDMLVIADENKPVGIAGIMGGEESEINSSTKCILLESANFVGPCIRRTSRKLGLRSEAAMRFEKGLDPELCKTAADRACQLIEKLGAGKVAKGYIDVYPERVNPRKIVLKPDKINHALGTEIPKDEMVDILERLGIRIEKDAGCSFAIIPTFRADIAREADLVEEVGRIYGYDRLPSTLPKGDATRGKIETPIRVSCTIKQILADLGYSEVYTYSFVSPRVFDRMNVPADSPLRRAIALMNPLSEEQSIMRTTLIPNMLDVVAYNLNQKIEEIRLYETGTVYIPKELPLRELPCEKKKLTIGLCGKQADFYELKKTIETLFAVLKIRLYEFAQYRHFAFHPGRCALVLMDGEEIGIAGEIHPDVMENYDINSRVYICELDMDILLKKASTDIKFTDLPRYPASSRDLAIVVEERLPAGNIIRTITDIGNDLVEKVELFDIYTGDQIKKGFKSLAFSLTYRAKDRTLTDEEINQVNNRIREKVAKEFNGVLRE